MHRKTTFLLGSLLLLSQHTSSINALPEANEVSSANFGQQYIGSTVSNDNSIITNEKINNQNNDNEWSERDKLLFYTLDQFALLSNFTVQHGTQVLRNVLNDAATIKEPTEILRSQLRNLSDYVARAEHVKTLSEDAQVSELYDMVVLFTELVEQYNTTAGENATTENMYLEMSLKKNGLDKLQVDFLERFLNFTDKFKPRIDSYFASLTAEERVNERKMFEWYQMFNDEANAEKKVDIFAKFFDLYT